MIIQCQHCNANFKIDKDKIPSKKSSVRCPKCSNLISVGGGVAESPVSPKLVVTACENCGAKYRIPLSKFKKDTIKVKCGKCGFYFKVDKGGVSQVEKPVENIATPEPVEIEKNNKASISPDVPKRINIVKENTSVIEDKNVNDIQVSKEEVDDIFSDFTQDYDENEGVAEFGEEDDFSSLGLDDDIRLEEHSISVEEDSNKAYLDSIQLSTDGSDGLELDDISEGSIPEEQKSRFFLNSGEDDLPRDTQEESSWPEIQDETVEEEGKVDGFQKDILESSIDLGGGMEGSSDTFENDIAKTSRLIPALVLFVTLLVALGAFGWYFLQQRSFSPEEVGTLSEEYSSQSKLQILEPLKGKYVRNKVLNKQIFVLQGKVKNFYDGTDKISHVEVEGLLYDDKNKVLSESKTLAGNNLTISQLESLSDQEIKSLIASRSDSSAVKLDLGFNQVVPFQIVFFNVPKKVDKLEARILRFSKRK